MPGSSPLSRGIPWFTETVLPAFGIIPALAGNTPATGRGISTTADHPRSRGEYAPFVPINHDVSGSSPLSRGIPGPRFSIPPRPRIIPALAGNTTSSTSTSIRTGDHPRSRGEYDPSFRQRGLRLGSSPLSRGILPGRHNQWGLLGIIPALAGNTIPLMESTMLLEDHPRSRGEYCKRATEGLRR